MKKITMLLMIMFGVMAASCSSNNSDDDKEPAREQVSVEDLCKHMFWVNSSTGDKTPAAYTFVHVEGVEEPDYGSKFTSNIEQGNGKRFTYRINTPSVVLTYGDGTTETVVIYKIYDKQSQRYNLEINGKMFIGVENSTYFE